MTQSIDIDKISDVLVDVAATYILPRYNALTSGQIDTKSGPNDLVTVADTEAEEALVRILPDLYPGSIVIGEESISSGKATLGPLKEAGKMVWVVDPVDGTYNFVHGKREFAVMLACVMDGEIRAGWIYDILGERTMTMEKGAGAYFEGRRLNLTNRNDAINATGHIGKKYFPKEMRAHLEEQRDKVKQFYSLSCAAHEYINLATGKTDFGVYSRIKPWDHLAGVLAVTEAGGVIAKWDSSVYHPSDDFGGLLVASHDALLHQIDAIFIKPILEDIILKYGK
ncbi:inositol monophosphatase family protein [Micavibrio aeruginosavorus]|uniref:inositol monophosphatase family protein n=1 Tax=Micavibrio aeruginosavorus TaxID=349221 RepID=UPI003F4A93CA